MATTNAGTKASETFGTTSPVTGSAPSSSTDGQPVKDLLAISVTVDTANGVTLSGAGTLDCYVYDPDVAVWARCKAGDFTVDATARAQNFEAVRLDAPRNGRIKWVPTAVTFGGGGSAGVTVYQLGQAKAGVHGA